MHKTGIGQDSHRFEHEGSKKPLVLGGIHIPGCPGLLGNSDADVVLHALTNAISGISGENIIGRISDTMCLEQGITDSAEYVKVALRTLGALRITHVSVAIEGKRPHMASHIETMKKSMAGLLGLTPGDVGITATSGEGLTAFGRGEGLQAFVVADAETAN
jgi:2-C-methyl-D-erythritol 2,4-cyclodiphosphate synthase